MLLKDFYTYSCKNKREGEIIADISINKSHNIFKGHFPETPVVPGVCQVQIIREIIDNELNSKFQISEAKEIKFLNLINPEVKNTFKVSISYEILNEGSIKISGTIQSGETTYLKIRAELKKKTSEALINTDDICIIIPSYNNAGKLNSVIKDVKKYTRNIIIINDGSTDNTKEVLHEHSNIRILTHPKNKGKGIALKTGFKEALKLGYKYAITFDSDGQHLAKDIPVFLDKMEENHGSIIIGARQFGQENMPDKNSFANKFSNFWFNFQTGNPIKDTQSGFRMYPLEIFENMRFFSSKYEFELEVIVRASWKGFDVLTVPIDVYYPPKEERITHFRPFTDFIRISILNTIFTFLAIWYYKPRNLIRKFRKKKIKQIIKEDIISGNTPTHIIAISIGFGVFMGIVPIWGYQLAVGLLIAHFLKLNKAVVFLAANISLPPFLPFILYLSYVTGSYIIGEGSWTVDFDLTLTALKDNLMQYLLGSLVFAVLAGVFFWFLSYLIIPLLRKRK